MFRRQPVRVPSTRLFMYLKSTCPRSCGFSRSPASQLFTHTSANTACKWAVVHLPEKYVSPSLIYLKSTCPRLRSPSPVSPSPWTSTAIAGPVMVAALVVGLLAAALAPPRWGRG